MTVRVFSTAVFDLFHKGHLEALRKASALGDYLLVGVHNDEETRRYKRLPIIPFEQRVEIVQALDFVDETFDCPIYLHDDFYHEHRIDIHCQGDPTLDFYEYPEKLGIMRYVGRDPEIDTTMIINRVIERYRE